MRSKSYGLSAVGCQLSSSGASFHRGGAETQRAPIGNLSALGLLRALPIPQEHAAGRTPTAAFLALLLRVSAPLRFNSQPRTTEARYAQ